MTAIPQKFRIRSFGCQMNVYDGERMAELLAERGMSAAADGEDADLVVLNTCHIREKAAEKAYSEVGRLRREDGSRPLIALAGCVAQAEGPEAKRRSQMIDMVVGPQAYHRLPEMVEAAAKGERPVDTDMPAISKFDALPKRRRAAPSAFLSVQEGCDKFCTYCVVPYTRGAEISRPWTDIVEEARALADAGAREIVLLGQNVNAWADGHRGLAELIRAIAEIDGLERIRYTTSHPADMTDALIAAHGEVGKLMPYLHLPVQSGSDRILKAMNRSHTVESYLHSLDKMRAARPDIALSGDFIVGFPGETDEDFEATLRIVDAVGYASAYSFKYSPRPGTPAAAMEEQIAPEVMDERLQRLQQRITANQLAFNRAAVGRDTKVLIERRGKLPGQMIGKSPWLQSVVSKPMRRTGHDRRCDTHRRRTEQHDGRNRRPGECRDRSETRSDFWSRGPGIRRGDGKCLLMARRDIAAAVPDRARLELEFEQPYLLGPLFGDYDRHLITIETRLGVHIAARGNRVQIEGEPDAASRAREVLIGLYNRLDQGHDVDAEAVEAVLGMAAQPNLDGIIAPDVATPPRVMIRTRKKTIVPRSTTQAAYMEALARDDMIFALGPAGTGKTYVAVAQAVSQLIAGTVDRLILSRPAVEAGERLGFLPGDMKEKVDPYLRPLYDALYDMLPTEQVERRIASGEIEIAPIAFMRGRTLNDAFIILDEAQNTTPAQMKMFLTRFGMRARMVICGDPNQVDLPDPGKSGLHDSVARLEGIKGLSVVHFTAADVVRHPLVGRIVEAYEGPAA